VVKGDLTGANPVDRGKASSKLHLAGDATGLPLSLIVSAANASDATVLEAVLDDIPAILMPTGHRRRRSGKVHADKAYDHRRCQPIAGMFACFRVGVAVQRFRIPVENRPAQPFHHDC
jgi:transposase